MARWETSTERTYVDAMLGIYVAAVRPPMVTSATAFVRRVRCPAQTT
jgi:hypothetical protein